MRVAPIFRILFRIWLGKRVVIRIPRSTVTVVFVPITRIPTGIRTFVRTVIPIPRFMSTRVCCMAWFSMVSCIRFPLSILTWWENGIASGSFWDGFFRIIVLIAVGSPGGWTGRSQIVPI